MSIKKEKEKAIHGKLTQLHNSGRIPTKKYAKGTELKRWQGSRQSSGFHYGRPNKDGLGRYNDPTGRTGVCYASELAVAALAESYGRLHRKEGSDESFFISSAQLKQSQICTLRVERELVTIDMDKLQPLLHITTDEITSDCYDLTNMIVNLTANELSGNYDGISYRSRHFAQGHCVALFEQEKPQLSTLRMEAMSDYKDSDYLPESWNEADIDAEEMLTEILDFKVVD